MQDVSDLLARSSFFAAAPVAERERIAAALVPEHVADGATILREGDEGDRCYLIRSGATHAVTQDLIGQEVELQRFGPGDVFGELALLRAGGRRSATIRADGPVELFVLGRDAFAELATTCPEFAHSAQARLESLDLDAFLKRASPLARLPREVLARIEPRLRVEQVVAGGVVIAEGDPPDAFRVVRAGRLAAVRRGTQLQAYGPGDCFGEVGMLTRQPRNATVRALETATLVVLERSDFDALVASEPTFARLLFELAGIRGGAVSGAAAVSDLEVAQALPGLRSGRRLRWPWVFGLGAALFGALTLVARGGDPLLLDLAVGAGALVGPITFVTYLADGDLLADRPVPVAAMFIGTGLVAVPVAGVLEGGLGLELGTVGGVLGVALIEEALKLAAVVLIARQRLMRFQRDGVIYGAAAGMGFAAFESFLYGQSLIASAGAALGVLWLRALLSPFGHGTWTAIAATALFRRKSEPGVRGNARLAAGLAEAVCLHALWDWQPLPGLLGLGWFLAVGVGGIALLAASIGSATRQSARAALALNPELAAGGRGAQLRCSNCGQLSLAGSHYCVRCGAALRVSSR